MEIAHWEQAEQLGDLDLSLIHNPIDKICSSCNKNILKHNKN